MKVVLDSEERELLRRLLEAEISTVRVRVHHTHDTDLRADLKRQERVLRRLLVRVGEPSGSARASLGDLAS